MGIQTGSFHPRTFYEAIDKTKALGLRYVESHPWQMLSPDQPSQPFDYTSPAAVLEAAKAKLDQAGVMMATCFFLSGKTEAELRKIFVFAKAMGSRCL